jgi:hypothetical protein
VGSETGGRPVPCLPDMTMSQAISLAIPAWKAEVGLYPSPSCTQALVIRCPSSGGGTIPLTLVHTSLGNSMPLLRRTQRPSRVQQEEGPAFDRAAYMSALHACVEESRSEFTFVGPRARVLSAPRVIDAFVGEAAGTLGACSAASRHGFVLPRLWHVG